MEGDLYKKKERCNNCCSSLGTLMKLGDKTFCEECYKELKENSPNEILANTETKEPEKKRRKKKKKRHHESRKKRSHDPVEEANAEVENIESDTKEHPNTDLKDNKDSKESKDKTDNIDNKNNEEIERLRQTIVVLETQKSQLEEKLRKRELTEKRESEHAIKSEKTEKLTEERLKQKDEETDNLKKEIESLKDSFFKNNKLLKSTDKIQTLFSVMQKINYDLKSKLEKTKEGCNTLMIMHNNSVQELRKVIQGKNERLSKYAEFYPDVSDMITIDANKDGGGDVFALEEKMSELKKEIANWVNKYNELLCINDRLRKKIETEFDSVATGNSDKGTEIEGSEEYYDEYEDYEDAEDGVENDDSKQQETKGWLSSVWGGGS